MENELKSVIQEYFQDSSYKIIDFVLRGEKGTKVLELYVDNKEGVNIDELAKINRDLNKKVEEKIVIKDISKLIVSSPGAERPFKYIWQLYKHLERTIEVELFNGERIEGKLVVVSDNPDENIILDVSKKEKQKERSSELKEINFKDIKESKVKISFSK